MKTIRARLLLGLMSGAVVCTLAATALLYKLADHEADEQSDQRLRLLAWSLPLQAQSGWLLPHENDPDERFEVQAWNAAGAPLHRSSTAPTLPLSQPDGYATVRFEGQRWRVYTEGVSGYHVQVSQPIAVRQRIAANMALRIAPPLLLLLPAMAVLIWVVVGRSMRPLDRLTRAVGGRTPHALQPLETDGLPPELHPIVLALNDLLSKVEGAISAQRNFVADAAHELRSPLTALKLQLQLAERAANEPARDTAFRKVHERLDRATHLVQQLMTLARQEQHVVPPTHVDCDLLKVACQVVADQTLYAESRKITLEVSAAGASLHIQAYPEGLAIMLGNLVDNALRYTHSGGRVEVAVGVEQGMPYLQVSDNGPGVPENERGRLFDRFYRPDGNAVWGSGLGLSIVKSVADAHQATLRLSTSRNGRGLTVTALFPVSDLMHA